MGHVTENVTLHHDMENTWPHYTLNMEKTWRKRARQRRNESIVNSTCGFPLGSEPIPIFHTASLFSSHRELSVIWNRNQLFTSSMCEAAQLHRGNPGEWGVRRGHITRSHHLCWMESFFPPFYRINNSAYCPGLSLAVRKEFLYTVCIYCQYINKYKIYMQLWDILSLGCKYLIWKIQEGNHNTNMARVSDGWLKDLLNNATLCLNLIEGSL